MDRHTVTLHCPVVGSGLGFDWVARCTCGDASDRDGPVDGTLATAREWQHAHEIDNRSAGMPAPAPLPAKDEPDHTLDSYDAFLRGVVGRGRSAP